MNNHKIEEANRQIRLVTNLGIAANIVLAAVKVAVGLFAGSVALVADGIHSISDMATDIAVLLGIHFGSKQPDEGHPYGHGRIETFAAVFIGLTLAGVGAAMIYHAAAAIAAQRYVKPGLIVLFVAIASIIVKELLYSITKRVAVKSHSSALYANAWHHRSDALSSVAVLCGGIAGSVGWGYGDRVAAIVVGLVVVAVGVNAIWRVFVELTEGSISAEESKLVGEAIQGVPGVKSWHRLRTRLVGREVFMDVHVLVDAWLSIDEAHRICGAVERAAAGSLKRPSNVVVHCEPDRGFTDTDGDLRSQD